MFEVFKERSRSNMEPFFSRLLEEVGWLKAQTAARVCHPACGYLNVAPTSAGQAVNFSQVLIGHFMVGGYQELIANGETAVAVCFWNARFLQQR